MEIKQDEVMEEYLRKLHALLVAPTNEYENGFFDGIKAAIQVLGPQECENCSGEGEVEVCILTRDTEECSIITCSECLGQGHI